MGVETPWVWKGWWGDREIHICIDRFATKYEMQEEMDK